jgi:hypothetical protein
MTLADLVEVMANQYGADPIEIRDAVVDFVSDCVDNGLMTIVTAPAAGEDLLK